jgi:glucose-6-phosphate 1-epimerase
MLRNMNDSNLSLPAGVALEPAQGGLPRLEIHNQNAAAEIYLHGAHITHWQPASQRPVLWVSSQSTFAPTKAIRGGVPLCFPWFGPKADDATAPLHGLARIAEWQLRSATEENGATQLAFVPTAEVVSQNGWPQDAAVELNVSVGKELEIAFSVTNRGQSTLQYEIALHTYFAVSDAQQIEIRGTEGAKYFDKVAQSSAQQDAAPLRITQETDRVYFDNQSTCILRDAGWNREISVQKSGSNTTVIWNPWLEKARNLPDFGDEEWTQTVCIETANAGANAIVLAPGQSHRTHARIAVQSLEL